jgi:hypothetical protein
LGVAEVWRTIEGGRHLANAFIAASSAIKILIDVPLTNFSTIRTEITVRSTHNRLYDS